MTTELYVFDLPLNVTEEILRTVFLEEAGPVEMVQMFHAVDTAYAFVRFGSHEAAKMAMSELNYAKLDGKPIRIEWGDEETRTIRSTWRGLLVFRNLEPSIEASQLDDALKGFGEVIYCKMTVDTDGSGLGIIIIIIII